MSIPLDRLYHHIENLSGDNIIIYRWVPHGSKKLADLSTLSDFSVRDLESHLTMICHDQEPLDYDYFELQGSPERWNNGRTTDKNFMDSISFVPNLRRHTSLTNVYDKHLLCHSEKNSPELEKFNKHYIGVYYWSHGIIARDWFRFAKYDTKLMYSPDKYTSDFLIYNRAWSGSREYRLKFSELLISNDLLKSSRTSFSPIDSGIHYTDYNFKNTDFTIYNYNIENQIPANTHSSSSSADYVSNDYVSCGIEVVLETLFDDSRNHLTEKTLRSIACGKPFILMSTPGSLKYLRDYGFKTFNGLIDETYDTIESPIERLECVIAEMARIQKLPTAEKSILFNKLNAIASYNQDLFFSDQWHRNLINEFIVNFNVAKAEVEKTRTGNIWKTIRPIIMQTPRSYAAYQSSRIGETLDELLNEINLSVNVQ